HRMSDACQPGRWLLRAKTSVLKAPERKLETGGPQQKRHGGAGHIHGELDRDPRGKCGEAGLFCRTLEDIGEETAEKADDGPEPCDHLKPRGNGRPAAAQSARTRHLV